MKNLFALAFAVLFMFSETELLTNHYTSREGIVLALGA